MKFYELNKNMFFYFVFFNLLSLAKGIGLDSSDPVFIFTTLFAFVFLFIHILYSRYTFKQLAIIILLISLCCIITLKSGKITVLMSTIAILFAKNIDFDKLLKSVFSIRLITFFVVMLLSMIGVLSNGNAFRISENGEIIKRYSLGFVHPNITYLNFFILVALYLYLKYENLTIKNYIFIFISAVALFKITDSRTGFITVILSIFISILFKNKNIFKNRLFRKVIMTIPLICGIISVIISFNYTKNNKLFYTINKMLTGRLELGKRFFDIYGINLFGQKVVEGSNLNGSYLRIDSGYISLIIVYGLLIFLIYLILQTKLLKIYIKNDKIKEIMLIILFSVYGLTEVYVYNVFINISLLFLSDLLYKNSVNNKKT
ncbi:hypothetical protein ACV3V5_12755 [Clostridium perfringens]